MYFSENPFTQQHLGDFDCDTHSTLNQRLINLTATFDQFKL